MYGKKQTFQSKREVRVWTVFLWTVVQKSENRELGRHMQKLAEALFSYRLRLIGSRS